MNEEREQFGVDSPKVSDKYTFESLARKKHRLWNQIILNLNPIYTTS